jgi:serine/threonine-protein kinase
VGDTSQVGSYPAGASPYAALDMAGNVYEWVNDWWQLDYYANSPYSNPPGPASGESKVLRGGYWGGWWGSQRLAYRGRTEPDNSANNSLGIRCGLSPAP